VTSDVVRPLLSVFCLVLLAVGHISGAGAQERIFDPENPGYDDDIQDDEEEADDGDGDAGDGENGGGGFIIDDPERPTTFDEPGDDDTDEAEPQQISALPSAFLDTEFSLDYEVVTLVNPGFGPVGQDRLEIGAGLGMGLRHEISPQTRAVVSGRFRYWAGTGRAFDDLRTHYEPRLDRAYLVHRPGRWSFAFGQMRNSWGSTDIIRPGDVIDPVDMRDPVGGGGFGSALSQLSATAGYSFSNWSLRALVVPFFQPNQVALFGRDTALANERNPLIAEQLPFLLLAEQFIEPGAQQYSQPFLLSMGRPKDLPQNASAGLRATTTLAGTDLGAGVFYGWDRTPWVVIDEDLRSILTLIAEDEQIFEDYDFFGFVQRNQEVIEKAEAGETIFDSKYLRRATILVDGARYIGPIGVRADLAFSPRRVFYTTDFEPVRRASTFSALGLSYERLLDGERPLALTLEGFWLHPFGVDSVVHKALIPEEQGGEEDDELLIFEGGYYGVAGAVNWHLPWWKLELSAGGLATISAGDFVGQFALERPWGRGIRTTLGASLFFGPDPSQQLSAGGLWAHNDRVYFAVGGQF
jgi:hypothetical protein